MGENGNDRSKSRPDGPDAVSKIARILFMDDKEIVRSAVCEVLTVLGYDVESAAEGGELLEKFRRAGDAGRPFDVVVVDLMVEHGMGGRQAIEKLRALAPAVRIVVSSGFPDDPVMVDYRKYGAVDVIVKPYDSSELDAVIRRVLDE